MSQDYNALNVIVPIIEEVRVLRDRLVSQLSAAGITLAVAKARIPIDDIDEWVYDASVFHQEALRSGYVLSNAALTAALQQGPLSLATTDPTVTRLMMQMMLGQTYKDKLSEWNADLPAAMQDAARLASTSSEPTKAKTGGGYAELILGIIIGGLGFTLLANDQDSGPGISLLIFGGLAFLKGLGTVATRLLENVGD